MAAKTTVATAKVEISGCDCATPCTETAEKLVNSTGRTNKKPIANTDDYPRPVEHRGNDHRQRAEDAHDEDAGVDHSWAMSLAYTTGRVDRAGALRAADPARQRSLGKAPSNASLSQTGGRSPPIRIASVTVAAAVKSGRPVPA